MKATFRKLRRMSKYILFFFVSFVAPYMSAAKKVTLKTLE